MRQRVFRTLKYLWTLPNTLIGLAIGVIFWGRFQCIDGVIEIHGPRIRWLLQRMYVPAAAMTLGHVVIGQDTDRLNQTRVHERVHVRQYERWGPIFLPAYFLASAWMWWRRRDPYRDNPFEVEAYDYERDYFANRRRV